jgi:hypothetical protein
MTLEELKDALRAADSAAVLIPGHLLARVIRQVTDLPAQVLSVPHRKSFILDRAVLLRHVDLDDLDLGPDRLLPSKIILLARPPLDRRSGLERGSTLLKYWRRLFHANVHLRLERLFVEGRLGSAEVAARVAGIGRTEFDEARCVLEQEGYLFPRATARDVYNEFAAVYLELRCFAPDLLPVYFPGIRDHRRVEEVLAHDVDAGALFEQTRLEGAAGPAPRPDASNDEPSEACVQLVRDARRASRTGNNVRSAILRSRAAHIAPAALTVKLQQEANADLDQLSDRLRDALKLTDPERAEWRKDLPALLDKTGDGQWSVEARLLYDLQNACLDHEREVYALDLVEWALSAGKRPIKRPLSGQRVVRITRHLRSAAQRLTSTRLSEADRKHLGQLFDEALRQNEERLRTRFRPVLTESLLDVGLSATNAPEQAAFAKLVEELLDHISEVGFFTFSDLRDAISRNNLKLPDLVDPVELVRGDPLLRLDRLLASSPLDGVYRPSEIYLRILQRLTAPNFGTRLGRLLTRYVTLPFGAALLILEGMDLIRREVWCRLLGTVYQPLFGPITVLFGVLFPSTQGHGGTLEPVHLVTQVIGAQQMSPGGPPLGAVVQQVAAAAVVDSRALAQAPTFLDPAASAKAGPPLLPFLAPSLWLLLGLLMLGLFYIPWLRRAFIQVGLWGYRAGRLLFVDVPLNILPWPALRRFLKSWAFQLVFRLVLKPLPFYLLLWWLFPGLRDPWPSVLVFMAIILVLNSRPGRGLEDAGSRGMMRSLNWLHVGLMEGLLRLIIQVFKAITDGLEYVLYTVDELLRFRGGDSRLSMVVRAVLGVVWFPVSYITRLYIVVLIEPGFNPLKAPISLLAAKFVYPIILVLKVHEHLTPLLEQVFPNYLASALSYSTLWLLPDVFGFLFWEMKENWKLYRANRATTLEPAVVGASGETVLQLLKPGFHSGTLPKLFAQLRKAEREAHETGAWRAPRAVRERLRGVELSLRRFVVRDVLALLQLSPEWQKRPLSVGRIELASNQIRIELRHADYPDIPLRVAIAEENGLLIATVEDQGWLSRLRGPERRTLDQAIAGMYKLVGIDLLRRAEEEKPAIHEEPAAAGIQLELHEALAVPAPNGASKNGQAIYFRGVTYPWVQWVDWWRRDRAGEPVPPPFPVLPAAPAFPDGPVLS